MVLISFFKFFKIKSLHKRLNAHTKIAFTLAEALITITILGVVSAMTIPDVIGNVQSRINPKCPMKINGACFGTAFKPSPISDCSESHRTSLGIKYACPSKDYWAGAVETAGGAANMPTTDELIELNKKLWVSGSYDSKKAASIGLPAKPGFSIWSSSESSTYYAYIVYFNSSGSTNTRKTDKRTYRPYAIPKGK